MTCQTCSLALQYVVPSSRMRVTIVNNQTPSASRPICKSYQQAQITPSSTLPRTPRQDSRRNAFESPPSHSQSLPWEASCRPLSGNNMRSRSDANIATKRRIQRSIGERNVDQMEQTRRIDALKGYGLQTSRSDRGRYEDPSVFLWWGSNWSLVPPPN